jgi:hypothetical protein
MDFCSLKRLETGMKRLETETETGICILRERLKFLCINVIIKDMPRPSSPQTSQPIQPGTHLHSLPFRNPIKTASEANRKSTRYYCKNRKQQQLLSWVSNSPPSPCIPCPCKKENTEQALRDIVLSKLKKKKRRKRKKPKKENSICCASFIDR